MIEDAEFGLVFGPLEAPPTAMELEQFRLELDPISLQRQSYNRVRLQRMIDAARRRDEKVDSTGLYRPGELGNERRRLLARALVFPAPDVPQRTVEDVLRMRFEAARIVDSDASFEERRAQLQALQDFNPDDDLSSEAEILAKLQSDQEDQI